MKLEIKETSITLPFIGKKKILEGKGDFSDIDIRLFKEQSKNFFYGTIHPTIVNLNEDLFEGMKKVSNYTILIDLKASEEEIWDDLDRKSIRWGINYAKKNGLKTYINKIENEVTFRISKEGEENSLAFAEGLLIIDNVNEYSILEATRVTEEGKKFQAMPLMYWEMILYSKKNGMLSMDLGGYGGDKSYGKKINDIDTFKARFGGKVVEQPIYATNWKYPFFRKILKLFSFTKSWYKKDKNEETGY